MRVSNEKTCSDEMTSGRHFGMLKRMAQPKRSRSEKGALLKQQHRGRNRAESGLQLAFGKVHPQ